MKKLIVTSMVLAAAVIAGPLVRAEEKKVDFVKDIQPIFAASCVTCHGADPKGKKPKGKFDMTTVKSALAGGDNTKDLVPGKAEESLVYTTLLGPVGKGDDEISKMPYKKDALTKEEIELIKNWINQGAKWPDDVKVKLKE